MRWPLRFQILLPLAGLTLVTVLAVSVVTAYLSARRARQRIDGQLQAVSRTLANSAFPLTSRVLGQTAALSGAQFIVTDTAGTVLATSREDFVALPDRWQIQTCDALTLGAPTQIEAGRYFHAAVRRTPRSDVDSAAVLHIFFPEESWRAAWRDAVTSPLAVGGAALVVAVLLAVAIAGRVTRPLRQLGMEVEKIAHGDFRTVPLPHRNDEVRDLAEAVDRMARTLARYEQQVRRNERLQTLGQLGGGMAHQIRNAATGCGMALDLLARDMPQAGRSEHLEVARRQLQLMEEFLGRLLTLGRKPAVVSHDAVNMTTVVEDALKLVTPAARHVHVDIEFSEPTGSVVVRGDHDSLQQLLVNLLINAVDASGCPRDDGHSSAASGDGRSPCRVVVRLSADEDGPVELTVSDSGPGPSAEVGEMLFEPLVTNKPDGTGLGLTVAREIAGQHGGAIRWERREGMTCFCVELPRLEGSP